jgi:hypothetical protein
MKNERIAVMVILGVSLFLSSVPYAVGYLRQPNDRQFMGIVSNVPDWTQYLAWMKGFTHSLVIEDALTPEQQQPAFFNFQWLVLGRLGDWLDLSSAITVQAFRLLTSLAFLLLTYRLCRKYFSTEPWAAWAAWLLICFSSGLGWVLVLEKRLTGTLQYPLDVYVAEPITFQNMIIYPHFLLAALLILLTFEWVVAAIDSHRMRFALLAGGLGLVLGLTHAYDLITVYSVLVLFTILVLIRDGFSWFPIWVCTVVVSISLPPAAYFYFLTTTDAVWRQVLAQFKNASVFTPDPLHLLILVGIPLILVLLGFDGIFPLASRSRWKLLVRVWFGVNFFLIYIPTDYQIHMLSGWQIPIGLLASEGLFGRLLPELAKGPLFKTLEQRVGSRASLSSARWWLVVLLFLGSFPTNAYLIAWRVQEVMRVDHDHYLFKDELSALDWLAHNTKPSQIVLSDLTLGQYIPSVAGNKVFLGHWAQTVDFYNKQAAVQEFFEPAASPVAQGALIDEFHISYVVYGRDEKVSGDTNVADHSLLTLVFETPFTRIYRTHFVGALSQ